MNSRRSIFQNMDIPLGTSVHAGLWLDKFVKAPKWKQEPHKSDGINALKQMISELSKVSIPDGYETSFTRWKHAMMDNPQIILFKLVPLGRAAIGLGEKGVTEIGLSLHYTWGVPYIPGSALKGLIAHTAHHLLSKEDSGWELKENGKKGAWSQELFGSTDEQGLFCILDARMVPPKNKNILFKDVLTSHHQEYYTKEENNTKPPSDTDSPNPVSFISTNCSFLVAVECYDEGWRSIVHELLSTGLKTFGIGAKTSAGYGRFDVKRISKNPEDYERLFRKVDAGTEIRLQTAKEAMEENFFRAEFEKWILGNTTLSKEFTAFVSFAFAAVDVLDVQRFVLKQTEYYAVLIKRTKNNKKKERALGILQQLQISLTIENPEEATPSMGETKEEIKAYLFKNIQKANDERRRKKAIKALQNCLSPQNASKYVQSSIEKAISALAEFGVDVTDYRSRFGMDSTE